MTGSAQQTWGSVSNWVVKNVCYCGKTHVFIPKSHGGFDLKLEGTKMAIIEIK